MTDSVDNWLSFGAFRLDVQSGHLLRGNEAVRLRRKSLDVLCYLATHPKLIVAVDELLEHCWGDVAVTPQTVTNVIYELRTVLASGGDPAWLQTVARRGYRFTAPVRAEQGETVVFAAAAQDDEVLGESSPLFVGRQDAIAFLKQRWEQVVRGAAKIIFLAGEPGVGKTTLINQFVHELGGAISAPGQRRKSAARFAMALGRCTPQHAEAEPYMPVLEAIEQLAHDAGVVEIMRRHASAWLVQMPWLLPDAERESLRASLAGIAATRMLREGKRLFVELAQRTPLLLILEDIHWADGATIDLIRAMASGEAAAPILLIATYRPRELMVQNPRLREALSELLARPQSVGRLVLDALPLAAVREYIERRFDDPPWAAEVAVLLNERSGGNALFLQTMADYLCERGTIVHDAAGWRLAVAASDLDVGIPEGLRELVHAQLRQLHPEQVRLLEAAAASGIDFTAVEVAAATEQSIVETEEACRHLVEHAQLIRQVGEFAWPDGEVCDRYRFAHALYQQALAERISTGRRRLVHACIGSLLEQRYGERAREIAPRLAAHFEAAGDRVRQAKYLELSVLLAIGRYAHREALAYIDRTLAVLARLPTSPQTTGREMEWELERGNIANATGGYREGADSFDRVLALARRYGDDVMEFRARLGLTATWLLGTSTNAAARAQAAALVVITERGHPELAAAAHTYSALAWSAAGDPRRARDHLQVAERALPQALPNVPRRIDLGVIIEVLMSTVLGSQGQLDEAQRRRREIARRAKVRGMVMYRQLATVALNALTCGETAEALQLADDTVALATEGGFDEGATVGETVREIIRVADPAASLDRLIALLDQPSMGIERTWHAATFLAALADEHRRRGQLDLARARIEEAATLGAPYYTAEITRIKGEIEACAACAAAPQERKRLRSEAERCFRQALEIARGNSDKLYELRAAKALVRLLDDDESRRRLRSIYESFTEGFETEDLREAADLLS